MDEYAVRRAHASEAEALARILADAFLLDPVSMWIFPDDDDRRRMHPAFFRIFVDLALAKGEAYTVCTAGADPVGAALWFAVDVTSPEDHDAEVADLVTKHCGEYAERFRLLQELMTANHPSSESHGYLAFVAVQPDRHGRGYGTALLSDRLRALDGEGRPAYLEASSERSVPLYARAGFEPTGTRVSLPGGPQMTPMWRPAAGGPPA